MILRFLFVFLGLSFSIISSAQTLTISSTGTTSNWSLSGNTLTVTGTANIASSVITSALSSGSLSVIGNTSSFTVTVSNPISSTTIGSSLTIGGNGNTGNVTVNSDITLAGGLTIRGGDVSINANITSSATGDIFLKGISGNNLSLVLENGKTISKSGGTGTLTFQSNSRLINMGIITTAGSGILNVVLWSDYDNTNNDGGVSHAGEISTNGGHVWMGGSSSNGGSYTWNNLTVGDGPSIGSNGYNWHAIDFDGKITTNGGDLLVWADMGNGGYNGIRTGNVEKVMNVGNGDIVLITPYFLGNSLSLFRQSGGTFTLVPHGGAFPNSLDWTPTLGTSGSMTGWDFTGDFNSLWIENPTLLTSLKIGSYDGMSSSGSPVTLSNSSNVTIGTAMSIAGPISLHGGAMALNANITSSGTNTPILVKATTNINLGSSKSITSTGGNVSLWADSDNNSTGYVQLKSSSSISSGGGAISLGGGSDLTSDFAFGSTAEICSEKPLLYISGVHMQAGVQLNSAGGNISVRGQNATNATSNMAFGVSLKGNENNAVPVSIISGAGKIAIHGVATGSGTVNAQGASTWGAVTLRSANTTADAISVIGDASALSLGANGASLGINFTGLFEATASGGGITFDGRGGAASTVVGTNLSGSVLALSGPITILGESTNNVDPIYFGAPITIGKKDGTNVTTSSSDVVLESNKLTLATNQYTIDCSGTFTYRPRSNSFSTALSWPIANLTLASSVSGLTLGKSTNTSDITLASATTINGPVNVYAGNINLNQNLITTGGNSGDVLLKSAGNIIQASGKSITTAGGDVTLWADSDNNAAGYIYITGGSGSGITSGGGAIFLGGGADLATGYARGSDEMDGVVAQVHRGGIQLCANSSLLSSGGNITLRGQNAGLSTQYVHPGIISFGSTIDAGSGKVALYGKATGSGSANAQGISREGNDNWIIRSSNASADAIQLIGDASGCVNSGTSLGVNFIGSIESTGGGGIYLYGSAGSGTIYDHGLDVRGNILANSGTITLKGENNATSDVSVFLGTYNTFSTTLGSKASTNVTASTSPIVIQGDKIDFNTLSPVNTTGALTIEPVNTSFSTALSFPIANLTVASTIGGLYLGKSGNTMDITIASATAVNGPINLYGGALNLSGALSTTNTSTGNMSLNGTTLSGGSLTVANGRTLTMNLSSNTNYAGTITGTGLNFVKNGSGMLTLPTPTLLSFAKMTISGGIYRLNGNQQLTLTDTLINNGTFTMKDGATFLQNTSGTSIAGSGTFKVEKLLTGNSATGWSNTNGRFWYMGVPMVNVARSSYGTYGATSNQLWSYTESTKSYTELTNGTSLLSAGTGYVHRRSSNDTLVFSAIGADGLYRSNATMSALTKTAGNTAGVHLISNPYMAYLDWEAIYAASTNIDPTFYIRTTNTTSNNISAIISYNASTHLETNNSSVSASAAQLRYIAPMQSIWVRVLGNAGSTGTVNMTRSMLSHQSGNVGLKSSTIFPTLARVNLVDGNNFDQLLVYLNSDMSNEVDEYDSEKMSASGAVQIYTMSSNKKLVMNGLRNNKKKVSVPLYLELPETKSYTLQLSEFQLEDGLILLEDKQEGTIQDFTIKENYTFFANSGLLQNRFVLHFILPNAELTTQGPSNNWVAEEGSYTEGGDVHITADAKGKVQIQLDQPETEKIEGTVQASDVNGKIVYTGILEGALTTVELNVPAGIYYLTVQSGTLIEKKKVFIQD